MHLAPVAVVATLRDTSGAGVVALESVGCGRFFVERSLLRCLSTGSSGKPQRSELRSTGGSGDGVAGVDALQGAERGRFLAESKPRRLPCRAELAPLPFDRIAGKAPAERAPLYREERRWGRWSRGAPERWMWPLLVRVEASAASL